MVLLDPWTGLWTALGLTAAGLCMLGVSSELRSWVFAFLWRGRLENTVDRFMKTKKCAFLKDNIKGRVLDVGSGGGVQVMRARCNRGVQMWESRMKQSL